MINKSISLDKVINLSTTFALCAVFCLIAQNCLAKSSSPKPEAEMVLGQNEVFKGDLDSMINRRIIRFLVTYSKTNYFLDGPRPRGATYDAILAFEKNLNKELKKKGLKQKHLSVQAIVIPVARDQLIPLLVQGKGDIAAANLTITKTRSKKVDFSSPIGEGVKEVVVTDINAPKISSLDDLSGQEVFVRKSSSYYTSLLRLNKKLKQKGKKPCTIELSDEALETEDLLEMLNANLISITIADGHIAKFWSSIFPNIKPHYNLTLRTQGKIAWAFRKDSPLLKAEVNKFMKTIRMGSFLGNVLFKRYWKKNTWVKNPLADKERKRFKAAVKYFEKYSAQYNFDWLMIAALAYQESGIDQKKISPAGAVGVMQLLPSTAANPPVSIPNIKKIENNIHAGVKYLDFLHRKYFSDKKIDPVNQMLLTFAAYNAGPARINSLRKLTQKMGLDPNVWFQNVERTAAKKIGRETVQYVSNIYKYYLAYHRISKQHEQKDMLKKTKK